MSEMTDRGWIERQTASPGSRNMTLRTLAALAHACRMRVDLKIKPLPQLTQRSETTGIDFHKLEASRRRLGIEGDRERWPRGIRRPGVQPPRARPRPGVISLG